MIKIRFKAQGANSMIGGFSSGDVARVGDALAKHLVEEACVAEYADAPPAAPAEETEPPAAAENTTAKPEKTTRRGRA